RSAALADTSSTDCRSADSTSAIEIRRMEEAMRGTTDVDSTNVRNMKLPRAPNSEIHIVANATTCAAALAAHNRVAGYSRDERASPFARRVYVISVGNYYVTFNPSFMSGEFVSHYVWDSSFRLISTWFG